MKLKYYLRGLGIGIIVTTVILAVSFSKKEIKMSDEEIMARAAQLGMVMQETETTEQGDTEQDPDGTDTGAKTEVVTEQTAIRTIGRTNRGRRDRAEYGNCS